MPRFIDALPTAALGSSGLRVTRLGLGGEGVLRSYGRSAEAERVVEAALAGGIGYFESARAYAGSEEYLGAILRKRREEIVLATKAHERTRRGALAMLERSLQALRTDRIDLWQFHDVRTLDEVAALDDPDGAYAAFADAKRRGLVRAIGVTGHHEPAVLRAALERVPFDTVLLPVNPADGARADAFERTVIPAARARGMGVIGMKVYVRGLALDPHGAGLRAEEAIAYALGADVDAVVVGCDSTSHVDEAIAAAHAARPLSTADRRALETRIIRAGTLAYYRGERPPSSSPK